MAVNTDNFQYANVSWAAAAAFAQKFPTRKQKEAGSTRFYPTILFSICYEIWIQQLDSRNRNIKTKAFPNSNIRETLSNQRWEEKTFYFELGEINVMCIRDNTHIWGNTHNGVYKHIYTVFE